MDSIEAIFEKSVNMNTTPPPATSDNYNKIPWGMHYKEQKRMPVQFC